MALHRLQGVETNLYSLGKMVEYDNVIMDMPLKCRIIKPLLLDLGRFTYLTSVLVI